MTRGGFGRSPERKLSAEVRRLGLPLEQVALRRVDDAPVAAEASPRDGAELVAYWRREGVIGSLPDIQDSQAHAREIRRQAERRARS